MTTRDLQPIHSATQRVPWFFTGGKVDTSPSPSSEVKKQWIYTSKPPIRLRSAGRKHCTIYHEVLRVLCLYLSVITLLITVRYLCLARLEEHPSNFLVSYVDSLGLLGPTHFLHPVRFLRYVTRTITLLTRFSLLTPATVGTVVYWRVKPRGNSHYFVSSI